MIYYKYSEVEGGFTMDYEKRIMDAFNFMCIATTVKDVRGFVAKEMRRLEDSAMYGRTDSYTYNRRLAFLRELSDKLRRY